MDNKIKNIEWISVDELLTYPNNAKKHDAQQIERMKRSIEQFGFNDPIAIDRNNVIIEGHGRLIASKELGLEKLPCIRLEHLTEEEAKAYRNIHNKLNMDTGFDYDMLAMDVSDIESIDMSEYGFYSWDLEKPEAYDDDDEIGEYIGLGESLLKTLRITITYKGAEEQEWLKEKLNTDQLRVLYRVRELMEEEQSDE